MFTLKKTAKQLVKYTLLGPAIIFGILPFL